MERNTQVPSYRKSIPPFKGELKSLRFSEVSRFFRELNSYQSEHNTSERGASHLAWSVRTQLTPPGISDDTFSQVSNKELFCIIRQEEQGVVDAVFITEDGQGNKVVRVRTRDLRKPDDSDIADAVNKKNEIILYVHHAIGFDINNPEDKAYLESYKNGTATNPPSIAGGAPPAKGGRGILI
jgi:hypothetical protein